MPHDVLKSRVSKTGPNSSAALWNMAQYHKLGLALKKDPEASMIDILSTTYPKQLKSFTSLGSIVRKHDPTLPGPIPQITYSLHISDPRLRFAPTDPCTVVHELSTEVKGLLNPGNLTEAIIELLHRGDILFQQPYATVLKIGEAIAVKINHADVTTEHRSLCYLEQHLPAFPAPRAHGLLRINSYSLLFTSFVPGVELEKAWPQMDEEEKRALCNDLDQVLALLRTIPFPPGTPYGGVGGEGCTELRRSLRMNTEPIYDEKAFQDFIFSGAKTASALYTNLLRNLIPLTPIKCVFTHGDFRPANIMVERNPEGKWKVAGVIDWEASGFYPEYWEFLKMTNNLHSREQSDWYRFLPASLSWNQYPVHWLVDRVCDRQMTNS